MTHPIRRAITALLAVSALPLMTGPASAADPAEVKVAVVVPLSGPSSLLMALSVSGLNGQSFAFVGYLPVDAAARSARIRELEALSRRYNQTQLMIETPYRNQALMGALVSALSATTRLSVSCGLTLPAGWTRSDSVSGWRLKPCILPSDTPAVFGLLGV